MTTHHLTHEEITAYLDGECTAEEGEQLASHLALCSTCAHEVAEHRAISRIFGSMGEAELSRSFILPPEVAKTAPLANPAAPATGGLAYSNLRRFEPLLRIVSIAAVLAFLLLGGGQMAGWIGDDSHPSGDTTMTGETEVPMSALQDQEPAVARGELREQGDSAAAGAGTLTATTARVDTPAQVNNGLTPLEITTVGIGVVALAAIASWVLIHYRAGSTS